MVCDDGGSSGQTCKPALTKGMTDGMWELNRMLWVEGKSKTASLDWTDSRGGCYGTVRTADHDVLVLLRRGPTCGPPVGSLTPGCVHRLACSSHCGSWWWGAGPSHCSSCCAARSWRSQSRVAGTGPGPSSHWGSMSLRPLYRDTNMVCNMYKSESYAVVFTVTRPGTRFQVHSFYHSTTKGCKMK